MTAKDIINEVLVKCNLFANRTETPFANTSGEINEIIVLLNSRIKRLVLDKAFSEVKITNTFNTYSTWSASTSYAIGDVIQNGISRFTCITEGISGTTEPTFSLTAETTDGTATWEYTGSKDEYILPTDLDGVSNLTFFNNSDQEQMIRLTDEEWRRKKAFDVDQDSKYFRFQGGKLYLYPTYDPETSISYEYYTSNAVLSTDDDGNEIVASEFTKDDDISLLPSDMLVWGAVVDWYSIKGLPQVAWALGNYNKIYEQRMAGSQPLRRVYLDENRIRESNVADRGWEV